MEYNFLSQVLFAVFACANHCECWPRISVGFVPGTMWMRQSGGPMSDNGLADDGAVLVLKPDYPLPVFTEAHRWPQAKKDTEELYELPAGKTRRGLK